MRARARPVGVTLGAIVVASACGFPQVSYTDAGGGDASGFDHVVDDRDSPVQVDGPSADEGSGMDSAGQDVVIDYVFEPAPDAPECDQDGDKYLEGTYMGMPTQHAYCADAGGNDCDDLDPNANPGITQFNCSPQIHPPTNGDWNCDGTVEVATSAAGPPIQTNISCDTLKDLLTCNQTAGFVGLPNCGGLGTWIQCNWVVTCNQGTTMQLPQCCK